MWIIRFSSLRWRLLRFAWNTASYTNGSHTISAVAHDAAGNTGTASVSVMVVNTTPTSLTAQITWPANGQTISRVRRSHLRHRYECCRSHILRGWAAGGEPGGVGGPVALLQHSLERESPGYHTVTAVAQGANGKHRDIASGASAGTVKAAAGR